MLYRHSGLLTVTAHDTPDAANRFPVSWTARERLLEAQRREREAVREFTTACRRADLEIAKRDAALGALQAAIDKANERVDVTVAALVEVSGISRTASLTALDESRVRELLRANRARRTALTQKELLEGRRSERATASGPGEG
jgi:hypothetical protein